MPSPTSGFQLSTVPQPVYFPSNAGVFDPTQPIAAANQATDYYTKLKNWGAQELETQSNLFKQNAQNIGATAQVPSATAAAIAGNTATAQIANQTTPDYISALNAQHQEDVKAAYAKGLQDAKDALTLQPQLKNAPAIGTALGQTAQNTAEAGQVLSAGQLAASPFQADLANLGLQGQYAGLNWSRKFLGLPTVDVPSIPSQVGTLPSQAAATPPADDTTAAPAADTSGGPLNGFTAADVAAHPEAFTPDQGGTAVPAGQPEGGPLTGATTPAATVTPQPVLAGAPAAASDSSPGAPGGTGQPGRFITTRDASGNEMISVMPDPSSPTGVSVSKAGPVPTEVRSAELTTQNNLAALGLNPKDYINQDGSMNIPAANAAVVQKIGQPTLLGDPSKGVPAATPNPAAGLPPDQAITTRHQELMDSTKEINEQAEPAIVKAQNAISTLSAFKNINATTPTGVVTGSELGQTIIQAIQQAKNLTGDQTPSFGTKSQELNALGNSLVPYLRDPTLNRVLAAEIPWLTANTPNLKNSQQANDAIETHVIAPLQQAIDYERYRTQFQAQKGTLMGAEAAWQGYQQANPIYDPKGQPNPNRETTAQYFTRIAQNPDQAGQPAPGSAQPPAASPAASTTPPKVTVDTSGVKYNAAQLKQLPSNVIYQGTDGNQYYGGLKAQ